MRLFSPSLNLGLSKAAGLIVGARRDMTTGVVDPS
jgi:hypothetical protein